MCLQYSNEMDILFKILNLLELVLNLLSKTSKDLKCFQIFMIDIRLILKLLDVCGKQCKSKDSSALVEKRASSKCYTCA